MDSTIDHAKTPEILRKRVDIDETVYRHTKMSAPIPVELSPVVADSANLGGRRCYKQLPESWLNRDDMPQINGDTLDWLAILMRRNETHSNSLWTSPLRVCLKASRLQLETPLKMEILIC